MRRAPAVLSATVAGVAAVLSFHPHTAATVGVVGAAGGIPGSVVQTRYGPVQVRILVRGGKLADVTAVQLPANEPRSVQINAFAAPLLRTEALAASSATVDVVSGATITSDAYMASLGTALAKAGLS
jgi:uncharacterized protein with FMN-binding domain